jgi:hypothetical protein
MKPKKSAGKSWGIAAGIAVAAVAVLWAPVLRPAWQRHRATKDVAALVEALQLFAKIEGDFPAGDAPTICRLLRGEAVGGQNARRLDYVEGYRLNERGEFVDPWGQAYRIELEPKVRVYSCGPNRKDEQGRGDDIVAW